MLLPGKSHGPRSLVGYSPWGRKESDTTERLHFISLQPFLLAMTFWTTMDSWVTPNQVESLFASWREYGLLTNEAIKLYKTGGHLKSPMIHFTERLGIFKFALNQYYSLALNLVVGMISPKVKFSPPYKSPIQVNRVSSLWYISSCLLPFSHTPVLLQSHHSWKINCKQLLLAVKTKNCAKT